MDKLIKDFIEDNQETAIGTSKLTREVKHDLAVTKAITKRKSMFMRLLGLLSLAIVGISLAGFTEILEFTPGVFTLAIMQLSWMFVVADLMRGVHLDVMRARLKYPELYTTDGRYYKRILSHELMLTEVERSVSLDEASTVPQFKKGD